MISFDFNPDKGIYFVKYDGLIAMHDMLEYMRTFTEFTSEVKEIKILEDARQGSITSDFTDIDVVMENFIEYSKHREMVVIATIQDKPVETALNLLFQSKLDLPNHHYKVFSTEEAALKWIESF